MIERLTGSKPTSVPVDGSRVCRMDSETATAVVGAMGSDTARRILTLLHERPRTPSELADELGMSIPNVQYHLGKLEGADLVRVVDTVYSEKGAEMSVYGPVDESVVFVPDEEREAAFEQLLTRVAGAFALLVVGSVLVQWFVRTVLDPGRVAVVRKATAAGELWPTDAAVVEPGLAFLAGGSFVLAVGVAWWYRDRFAAGID